MAAVSGIVLQILNVLIILAGIILVIVFFIKKLKRDELEYQKGIWAGSICWLFFIGNVATTSFESFGLSFVIEFILPAFFGGILLWGIITIAFAPVCMVWAVFYKKEDFVTVLVASSVGLILIRMEEIVMLSSSSIPIAGAIYGSLAVFYIFGYYLIRKGVSFSDVALYVPEYVIRLEEKDRINERA